VDTNAFIAGAQAGSGTNIPSQFSIWNYFDAAGVQQDYFTQVNSTRTMVFSSSVGNSVAKFDFEGGLSVNSATGVTCSGVTAATVQTLNGLVTHC
jgi:hypothetical protein